MMHMRVLGIVRFSLLSYETREAFKQMGSTVEDGSFGENLLISGIDFNAIEVEPVLK